MDDAQQKRFEIMPPTLKRGLSKYFGSKHDANPTINVRIMIIIGVFSLLLIFIGTIILLNSYTPHATSINSEKITITPTSATAIIVPAQATKANMLSLQAKLSAYEASIANDEQVFESTIK